ncbi:unnamed protein product [Chilo suppressalis]|uniref:RRM domain-containing protein n=1 Tax=Chilo suppressalis TaxID=168631 RepID=A0ABN8B8Z6_CHISP|nr:hypothetical protein evm_010406 [Chilo suppressalis]CAH0403685.1 unnamed protein product [Chilo suppressalis]
MAVVELARLPSNVKMPKLLFSMRGLLKGAGMKNCKFWILELADSYNSDLKEAKIEFPTYEEALKAVERLDNLKYRVNTETSVLTARISGGTKNRKQSRSPYRSSRSRYRRSRSRSNSFRRYYSPERVRSRSPLFRETTSKLDLELELLRKKRLVIEEERRLLMEQKKLDMIREYGPSISRDMDYNERDRIRSDRSMRETTRPIRDTRRPIRESTRPIRESTRLIKETARPIRERSRPIRETKMGAEGVPTVKPAVMPNFYKPRRLIMMQMKSIISEHTEPEERQNLEKLIGLQLRKRLAEALQNETYLRVEKVVELYRTKYPEAGDKEFVTEILKNLRMSHWHLSDDTKKVKKDNGDQKNKKTEIAQKIEVDQGSLPVSTEAIKKEPEDASPPKLDIKVEIEAQEAEIKLEDTEPGTSDDLEAADDWIENGIDWDDDENEEDQEPVKMEDQ